jgi:DNA-binding transcriptional MerR regulator
VQLERLQQILFYRELGFPLKIIRNLMNGRGDHTAILREQRELMRKRQSHLTRLLDTLDRTLAAAEGGPAMSHENLFEGFKDETEWNAALAEHNQHLQTAYNTELPPVTNAAAMNDLARQAQTFQLYMAKALRDGRPAGDEEVKANIRDHLTFLQDHGHATSPAGFVTQTQFFIEDDFHRAMLENIQTGLSYYLCAAARAYMA